MLQKQLQSKSGLQQPHECVVHQLQVLQVTNVMLGSGQLVWQALVHMPKASDTCWYAPAGTPAIKQHLDLLTAHSCKKGTVWQALSVPQAFARSEHDECH